MLPPATYTVTFSGPGIENTTMQTTVGSKNVKLDLIDPATGGGSEPPPSEPPPPPSNVVVGTASGETLNGRPAPIRSRASAVTTASTGRDGNDRLEGGAGRDYLYGSTETIRCSAATETIISMAAPGAIS